MRTHFDERLTTRISSIQSLGSPRVSPGPSTDASVDAGELSETDAVQWVRLKRLETLFQSDEFRMQRGSTTCMACCAQIAVGTSKGAVVLFDHAQSPVATLQAGDSAVSAVQFSADSTHVAAGHADGTLVVWSVAKPNRPVLTVQPSPEGHDGNPITQIQFLGKRHTGLLTTDSQGTLVYHSGYSTLLGLQCSSRTLVSGRDIRQCSVLPLGTSVERTDSMGVVALSTPDAIQVLSTHPNIKMHARIRPSSKQNTACASWLPALKVGASRPLLAYCFGGTLNVVRLAEDVVVDREGHENVVLRVEPLGKRWKGPEPVVSVEWVNSRLLALLTQSLRLMLVDFHTMGVASVADCEAKHVRPHNGSYTGCFRVYRGRFFLLGQYALYLGTLENWADRLLALLHTGDVVAALELAAKQYVGDCDLAVSGLPDSPEERHELVAPHVKEILTASADHIFVDHPAGSRDSEQFYRDFLATAIHTLVVMDAGPAELEAVFERFQDHALDGVFLAQLETFILNGRVTRLSPVVFQALVERCIADNRGAVLEELICLLDIRTLDIDHTIALCKAHGLHDILVYIWNVLLDDYVSPLFDFVREMLHSQQKDMRVYANNTNAYLGYVLTGRQYPTERPIDPKTASAAKRSVYLALFSATAVSWPVGSPRLHVTDNVSDEPAYPYLWFLCKYDSFSLLRALNEAFEDTLLNDDEEQERDSEMGGSFSITRQHIVDILLGVFRNNEFSKEDHFYLGVFIARNYPKYLQFLRISDGVLQDVIKKLCFPPSQHFQEEAEYALQSLLSVFHPSNIDDLASMFESCGYYRVLFTVFRSEKKMLRFLQLWNRVSAMGKHELLPTEVFKSTSELLTNCFEVARADPKEEQNVMNFVKEHFDSFMSDKPEALADVLNTYAPALHSECLHTDEDKRFQYLSYLYSLEKLGRATLSLALKENLVKLLAKRDSKTLSEEVLAGRFAEVDLDEIAQNLKEAGDANSVVQLYVINKKPEEAVALTAEMLEARGDELVAATDDAEEIEAELFRLLRQGVALSRQLPTQKAGSKLSKVEQLMLKYLEVPVKIFKSLHQTQGDSSYVHKVAQRLMQEAFLSLIDLYHRATEDEAAESSFLRIFSEFLNRSSAKVTTLGDVRQVVRSVHAAYSYEREILRHVLLLVNDDIFVNMEALDKLNSSGWTIRNTDCHICGRKLWGAGISSEVYEDWAFGKTRAPNPFTIQTFQCGHGYHRTCLADMAVSQCLLH